MIEGLSESDFLRLLEAAQGTNALVVGGQALNLWARVMLNNTEFNELGLFTSIDIDFWGDQKVAQEIARKLSGKVLVPENKFDHTPSSACVSVILGGKAHQIDFLRDVCGLTTKDFLKRASEVSINNIRVTTLHPLDVLKSRIAGILILRRHSYSAIRQLKASAHVVSHFIESCLDRGEIKQAQGMIKEFMYESMRPACDVLYQRHQFDIEELVTGLAQRDEWHEKFRENQIINQLRKLSDNRDRRLKESERRLNKGSTTPEP